MIEILWTNFGHKAHETFTDMEAAVAFGQSKGLEFTVLSAGEPVAAWTVFGGLRIL